MGDGEGCERAKSPRSTALARQAHCAAHRKRSPRSFILRLTDVADRRIAAAHHSVKRAATIKGRAMRSVR